MRGVDAGVEDRDGRAPGRVDGAVDLVPADARQRPLVGVLRVTGGACGIAREVGVNREYVAVRLERGYTGSVVVSRERQRVQAEHRGRVTRRTAGSKNLRALHLV